MYEERTAKVLKNMEEKGLEQMLVSDPPSIYYLTGKWILPNERLLALYLNKNGNHKLFVNKLFTVDGDIGIEKVWFSDTDPDVRSLPDIRTMISFWGLTRKWQPGFCWSLWNWERGAVLRMPPSVWTKPAG